MVGEDKLNEWASQYTFIYTFVVINLGVVWKLIDVIGLHEHLQEIFYVYVGNETN